VPIKYLSEEWAQAMQDAVSSDEQFAKIAEGVNLKVQQNVTGGPDGDVIYSLGIVNGRAFCELGELMEPDMTITQTYEVSVALAKGDLGLQEAFMGGKLKVEGNLALAMQYQEQLRGLESAVRAVEVEY